MALKIRFNRDSSVSNNYDMAPATNLDKDAIKKRIAELSQKKLPISEKKEITPTAEVKIVTRPHIIKNKDWIKPEKLSEQIWEEIFPGDIDDVRNRSIQLYMAGVEIDVAFKQANIDIVNKSIYRCFEGLFEEFWEVMGGGIKTDLKIRKREKPPQHLLQFCISLHEDINQYANNKKHITFDNRKYHMHECCLVCGEPIDDIRTCILIPSNDGKTDYRHRTCNIELLEKKYISYIKKHVLSIREDFKQKEKERQEFWKNDEQKLIEIDNFIEQHGMEAWLKQSSVN